MALNSPGVEVSLINNTAYPQVEAGTTPLIILATAENKVNPSGTGTAIATAKVNAGKLVLSTNRQELSELYGDAIFTVDSNGNPIHASETSEYGLQAAYSYAGVAGGVYTLRADIDLNSLKPTAIKPEGLPNDGTFWLDTTESNFGLFQAVRNKSSGAIELQKFDISLITEPTIIEGVEGSLAPKAGYGVVGTYAAIVDNIEAATVIKVFYRETGSVWTLVGSDAWKNKRDESPLIVGTLPLTLATELPGYNGIVSFSTTTVLASGDDLTFSVGSKTASVTLASGNFTSTTNGPSTTYEVTSYLLKSITSGTAPVGNVTVVKTGTVTNTTLSTTGQYRYVANLVYDILYRNGSVTRITDNLYETPTDKVKTVGDLIDSINATTSEIYTAGVSAGLVTINGTKRFALYAKPARSAVGIESVTISTDSASSGFVSILGVPEGVEYKTAYIQTSAHTVVPSFGTPGSVWFKSTQPNNGASLSVKLYDESTGTWNKVACPMASVPADFFRLNSALGGLNVPYNAVFLEGDRVVDGAKAAVFKMMRSSISAGEYVSSFFSPPSLSDSSLAGKRIIIQATAGNGSVNTTAPFYVSGYAISISTTALPTKNFKIRKGGKTTGLITASSNVSDTVNSINSAIATAGLKYITSVDSNGNFTITSSDGASFQIIDDTTNAGATDEMKLITGHYTGFVSTGAPAKTVTVDVNMTSIKIPLAARATEFTLTVDGTTVNIPNNTIATINAALGTLGYAITDYSVATPSEIVIRFPGRPTVTASGITISAGRNTTVVGSTATFSRTQPALSTIVSNLNNALVSAGASYVNASISAGSTQGIVITNLQGGDIRFIGYGDFDIAILGVSSVVGAVYTDGSEIVSSRFSPLLAASDIDARSYFISETVPRTTADDGSIWYNSLAYDVDIMVNNGSIWVGYRNAYPNTNPTGPIVSATQPKTQTDKTPLEENDLWIDTSDIENYPVIKRYRQSLRSKWEIVDVADQTTEAGITFHDARWATSGAQIEESTIEELTLSNFVDFDAPDPSLYPAGMLLWNLRRSGFNVKKLVRNYVDTDAVNPQYSPAYNPSGTRPEPALGEEQADYHPHRWVTISQNQADGSGSFGRKAQRAVVVKALQAAINSNDIIRDVEANVFDIIACPGYPELINEMINLNTDRGNRSLIIGDAPARLDTSNTGLRDWANNTKNAIEDGDRGLVSMSEYLDVYALWGSASDNAGNNIVVPPSHMMLYTIANSDRIGAPWFAPAGVRRGMILNASSVGTVTPEGEFKTVSLGEDKRSILYQANVNSIAYLDGTGLVCMGQKTRAPYTSAMDRVNVVRFEITLREVLRRISRQFLFEQNDTYTQQSLKSTIETVLRSFITSRAIEDFLVVCDSSNNTKARVARNELWADVAVLPLRSSEFIYIPMRLDDNIGA